MALPTLPPRDPGADHGPDSSADAAVVDVPSLRDIVHTAITHGASDVHIRAGAPPIIRVAGDLWPLDIPPLTEQQAQALVLSAMATDREREEFLHDLECDFAYFAPGIGRFRANAYRSRGGAAMVLRHVKEVIPTFEELGLPRVAHDMALLPSGLVLVCGPTGSGKTTTLAAMIDAVNTERRCHILTIEDPIEFLHANKAATISQRELHTDTKDFSRALRSGMRQDPDVILVGEIRDVDTLRTALQAAETGHLVLATLHARTVVDAVNRVIDIFPVDEQRQARLSIAESLQGVMCQHLVKSADGSGRTLVLEVGVATPRVREAIGDPEKTGRLQDIVSEGQFYGMRTFEQDAVRLVMSGQITIHEAEKVVPRAADLHVALRRAGYREPDQA
ncbi:MAG: PilT/PilU family type 4a pilus ATPase [Actinomycetales bacterium]|nr:PilT/PilU family type 4a pilus ATPase [Actinomycetales bacterium]